MMHGFGPNGFEHHAFGTLGLPGIGPGGFIFAPVALIGVLFIVGVIVLYATQHRATPAAQGAVSAAPATVYSEPIVAAVLRDDDAEQIVRARLARGEIDAEEYARLIATLRNV